MGVGPPAEVDKDGPLPFGPPMTAHLGISSFDGLIIWAYGMPNSLGPGPEKLFRPVETGGPETGLGLGFSGLRPESLPDLSCDEVDAEDFNPPLLATSSGGTASTPNVHNEDAMERRYVGAMDSEINSFGKLDELFSTITKYEAQVIHNEGNHASVISLSFSHTLFGQALLPRSSSSLRASYCSKLVEDQRSLRMVTTDKREWRLIASPGVGRIQEKGASP